MSLNNFEFASEVGRKSLVWDYQRFKQELIHSKERFSPLFENLPKEINAGNLNKETDECIKETLSDTQHRERGVAFTYTNAGHIVAGKRTLGEPNRVSLTYKLEPLNAQGQIVRQQDTIMITHSHPENGVQLFSIQDLFTILMKNEYQGSTVADMLGTSKYNYLLIRTSETG